ncbi:D-allulose 6-phosphate 3-epimerase [Escherichia coli]|uniref:D-allulose 6-phosphate 3-epimerase n=1 Tax=Escherichia coli TaxID=562 RepID=UPI002DB9DB08|nr:D-allulose 6-phosphate 3-epimerase [Escherichia coli]MEC4256412.1 D-allulose 6-phosphate 3-epimerase [Escherichia coli]
MIAKFSPSLMCMDLTRFREQIEAMNNHAAFYHVDIMDGSYFKNITLSPFFIEHLRKITDVPIDVHLMVNHPEDIIPLCIESGADIISFHPETANNKIFRLLTQIKEAGRRCGVVLNPATPADSIREYAHLLDKVTVMSVDPGFAGQKFIPETLDKIRKLIEMREEHGFHYLTEIDGSCNAKTFKQVAASGVEVFIVGTSGLFNLDNDVAEAWQKMESIFARETAA